MTPTSRLRRAPLRIFRFKFSPRFHEMGPDSVAEAAILRQEVRLPWNLKASQSSIHLRLMSLIDVGQNLTLNSAFLCGFHESHFFRVVQPDGPGMLFARYSGDELVVIPFVSPSEWPNPVLTLFRAGTRSTIAKNS